MVHLDFVIGMAAAELGISVVPALTPFHFPRSALVTHALKLTGLKRRICVKQREREFVGGVASVAGAHR